MGQIFVAFSEYLNFIYLLKLENDYIFDSNMSDLTKMMSYWPLTTFPVIITYSAYIHIFSERNENTSPSTKSRNPYRKK